MRSVDLKTLNEETPDCTECGRNILYVEEIGVTPDDADLCDYCRSDCGHPDCIREDACQFPV